MMSLIVSLKSVEAPFDVFEENPQFRRAPPVVRVEKMFEDIQSKLPGAPKFLLCLLPERKNCDVYGLSKSPLFSCFSCVEGATLTSILIENNCLCLIETLRAMETKESG